MGRLQSFQEFLATQSARIPITDFLLNLCLAAALSFVLRLIYIRYGTALSNRKMFANNFILITVTTMLVISVVKSSLALSLGLVGALSIVRFRAAIKDPEELAFLFLAIAIGLGFGASQRVITILAFAIITGLIWIRSFTHLSEEDQNLYLTVSSQNPQKTDLHDIVDVLKAHCVEVNLKRFDETDEIIEAVFLVEIQDFSQLQLTKTNLQKLGESIKVTFLDCKGIGG